MKNVLEAIFMAFFIFGLFYLVGCFFETSFNIANWSEGCRWFIGSVGGLIAMIAGGAYLDELETNHKKR